MNICDNGLLAICSLGMAIAWAGACCKLGGDIDVAVDSGDNDDGNVDETDDIAGP